MPAPDPGILHPLPEHPRVVLLRPLVQSEKIEVGDYTYYDDPVAPTAFETNNVLYAFGPERLVIGRYCCLATGIRFVMPGGNHASRGPSAFPFTIFGGDWAERTLDVVLAAPSPGDTVVGNDVWFGMDVTVMPGVTVGDGAIIATGSVVVRDVEAYTVVGGNPARELRRRFGEEDVARLLRARWWDWPVELVTEHVRTIMTGTPSELEVIAREAGLVREPDAQDR